MSIILHLDRIMADRKMSLNDLADKVGITNVNMSRIKTGKIKAIRFSTLNAICKVLECEPGDILKYLDDDDDLDPLRRGRGHLAPANTRTFYEHFKSPFDKRPQYRQNKSSRESAHNPWGCSSAGRASRSQRGGRGFESHHLHHGNSIGPEVVSGPISVYELVFHT